MPSGNPSCGSTLEDSPDLVSASDAYLEDSHPDPVLESGKALPIECIQLPKLPSFHKSLPLSPLSQQACS